MIVVGLDGLDPRIVEAMTAAGELPHLAQLREQGGYSRLATTTPAQTPVAWSTFATGVNPGKHGIFDFLRRDARTYLPDHALYHYEQKNAFVPPKAVNRRRAEGVWSVLARASIGSSVLRHPCLYPCDATGGRLLAGVGVPDLRGGFGTSSFYTTRPGVEAQRGESVIRLESATGDRFETHLLGARTAKEPAGARTPALVTVDRSGGAATLKTQGQPAELKLKLGEWSGWLRVKFPAGPLQSHRGMLRFILTSVDPEIEIYASPVNFDPVNPPYPICRPETFAEDIAAKIGLFYTVGMAEDHTGLGNGRISEARFLDQCDDIWNERDRMFERELAKDDAGLFYCLYDTPDRVQHMFWRFREPGHPALRGNPPHPDYRDAVAAAYRRADSAVGKALEHADDKTLFIALSDHGFTNFERGFHVNSWLREHGLLAVKPGCDGSEDLLRSIDWEKTSAYAVGLGGVYLNLKDRESKGAVAAPDAEALKDRLIAALEGLADPVRGATAITRVRKREDVYVGPYVSEAPDLLVDFAPGYRVSWNSSIGVVAGETFEDNTEAWSGDHMVDPLAVPGVLFMNRPFDARSPALIDLAPTILQALGVAKTDAMEGRSLVAKD